jgi:hypothetical protein
VFAELPTRVSNGLNCASLTGVDAREMDRRPKQDSKGHDVFVNIVSLPPRAQHEAMLAFFASGLRRMSRQSIERLRVELVLEFPRCPCGCNNRVILSEILEGHLVLRKHGLIRCDRKRS